MPACYVHWRDPKGEPAELLAEIGKTASIDANGNPSWIGLSVVRWNQAVVGSTIVLDPEKNELNRRDTASIMTSAISTVIRRQKGKTPLKPSNVRAEANKRAAQFYRKPLIGYCLVSSLSVKSIPFKTATIDDCKLSCLSHRKRYSLPQALRLEYLTLPDKTRTKWRKHQLVRVKAHGRSIHEAAGRAIEALTHLCGVWNLLVTRGSWRIGSPSRMQHPIGVVHVGPFHTLHDDGGAPVDDIYWFEPDALEPYELFIPKNDWDKIEKNRRWVARRLRSLPYARDLRRLILRYAKAVSHANADVAFL